MPLASWHGVQFRVGNLGTKDALVSKRGIKIYHHMRIMIIGVKKHVKVQKLVYLAASRINLKPIHKDV